MLYLNHNLKRKIRVIYNRLSFKKIIKFSRLNGFALPTILLSSIIMLTMLTVSVSSIAAVRVASKDQYYNQLAKTAGDAGAAYAQACLDLNSNVPQWSNAKPLKPNTNCLGDELVACPDGSVDNSCWVTNNSASADNKLISTFSVPAPTLNNDLKATNITVTSSTSLLRTSNNTSWRSYAQTTHLNKIEPQSRIISSGELHTCAIASDIQVYCWGRNGNGQLGNNSTIDSNIPVRIYAGGVLFDKTIKSLSVGDFHSCVIASDDQAYCWGRNSDGAIGDGTTTERHVPTHIDMTGVLSGKTIKSISAAEFHTCAIASDDKAYCWGNNLFGKLGDGTTTNSSSPVPVNTGVGSALNGKTIKSLSSGYYHTCAIANDDKAYCWGNNANGRLGDGTNTQSSVPVAVYATSPGLLDSKVIKFISTGNAHTCVIAADDTVSDGDAYCWGYNSSGQLGNNSTTTSYPAVKVVNTGALSGLKIKYLSSNNVHTCAIATDNKLYCWGDNYYGQLGDGTTGESWVPRTVYATSPGVLDGKSMMAVSGGDYHTCAIDSNSRSYCWGDNFYGQLGNASTTQSSNPVVVSNLPYKYIFF